jgi:hypothetical protein
MLLMTNLTIRSATAADTDALTRLAALDSAQIPAAPQLVAVQDDELIAAISARDGAAIADPFTRSAGAVEMLRRRARQLDQRPASRRRLTALRTARV